MKNYKFIGDGYSIEITDYNKAGVMAKLEKITGLFWLVQKVGVNTYQLQLGIPVSVSKQLNEEGDLIDEC